MIEYWKAGQRRIAREARDRMADMYRAVRDGQLSAEVLLGRAKGDHVPPYVRTSAPAKGIDQLVRDFPGAVAHRPPELRH